MNGEKLKFTLDSYSSQYSTSYPATNAFDGSTGTRWRTSDVTGAWLILKLESRHRLTGFRLYGDTSSYRVASFTLSMSTDGVKFTDVYSGTTSATGSWLDFEIDSSMLGEYIKITFNSASTSRLYVYEFEVYGTPIECKYLLRSNDTLYTITDNILTSVDASQLTAETFQTYGFEEFPDWSVISELTNTEILYWEEYENSLPDSIPEPMVPMSAVQTAIPPPQCIISNRIDLTHLTITGIERVYVTCEGNALFAVSFDNKQTWKVWTGSEWATVSEEFSGMTKELFESIVYDNWTELYSGANSFYIKAYLFTTDQSITQIYVDFAN